MEGRRRRKKGHPPRLVLLPAQPHPNSLLHLDTGAGPVQNLVLHCKRQKERRQWKGCGLLRAGSEVSDAVRTPDEQLELHQTPIHPSSALSYYHNYRTAGRAQRAWCRVLKVFPEKLRWAEPLFHNQDAEIQESEVRRSTPLTWAYKQRAPCGRFFQSTDTIPNLCTTSKCH